jgi:hypothetical protein
MPGRSSAITSILPCRSGYHELTRDILYAVESANPFHQSLDASPAYAIHEPHLVRRI